MDLVEAVYRGFNIATREGYDLWSWHSMIEKYAYAILGAGDDTSIRLAETGYAPWDVIVLSDHVFIGR